MAAARLALVALLILAAPASAVTLEWVTVGNPGNACDVKPRGCFGAVAEIYRIGKFEVTNAQYVEFLNAVARSDPNGLYDPDMDASSVGGITRAGDPGSFQYSVKAGREEMPVNFVGFYDAARFVNWLHNRQPAGAQDPATTEDGAYTITVPGLSTSSIKRSAGARFFLPSHDEWYKAAYHNAMGLAATDYFDYPAGTDSETVCSPEGRARNRANCRHAVGDVTPAGSYERSASPWGTFDQGGNVGEWDEAIRGPDRGNSGSSWQTGAGLAGVLTSFNPMGNSPSAGFRVAGLPAPELLVVEIDIKPGNAQDPVNPTSHGVIRVAVLGSEVFDVVDVDVATLAFGPDAAPPAQRRGVVLADLDGDGFTDLVAHYRTAASGIESGQTEACVTGELLDATPFEGCDAIDTVP